jgi:GT2 family glycosyltransferase
MTAISVIVATRERPRELADCLDSLLAQIRPAARIVVVDDAPGGAEVPAIVACRARDAPLRYVAGPGRGLAAAHNRGLLKAETPLVAFTDDDVIADPRWLEAIVAAFESTPGAACVTGRIVPHELATRAQRLLDRYAGYDKGATRQVFSLGAGRPQDPLFPFAAGKLGSGANMAFSREALELLGGFDPALGAGTRAKGGDDLAAFFEVLQHGHRLVYEPAAVVAHRHAREAAALPGQLYGYGVGLTAYLTKCVLDRPRLLPAALLRLPAAAAHVLGRRSGRNARLPADFPPDLLRAERRGMLAGPFAYVASRRSSEREA